MDFFRRFTVLIAAPAFDADDLEGHRLDEITLAIEKLGFQVIRARRIEDAEIAVQTDSAIGCMVVDWGKKGLEGKTAALINLMRKRGLELPIVILVRRKRLEDIPVEVMDYIDGYIFLAEETPQFIARNLVSRLKQYAETLKTPFFGALVDYAEEGNQLWTCPGHNGGVFYNRSPIGRIFVEHLGEAVFRDDLDNSVLELGDLLVHEGPALKAQQEAAAIFGAEKTYFVLNGTSSSNKIVLQALVAEGDLVLFDRNNHKAAHHGALFLGGGIPIYLETDRNAHGLIGPIFHEAFDEAAIRDKIRRHPLVTDKDAWKRERPFRVAVIEQCTYDGTINDARLIVEKIGRLCDYILFDEAWAGFMKFHPIYAGRFAMGLDGLGPDDPGIIATQSTHKQLASFSQASQIHIKDSHIAGQRRRIEHRRFNEFFMLHASTSPFYPLFASLDVGAQMMKGKSGEVLWDDTIRLGIELRKKVRAIRREFAEREQDPARRWFFEAFVPDQIGNVPWEDMPTDELASNPRHWELAPGATWHGFSKVAPGYAITDPSYSGVRLRDLCGDMHDFFRDSGVSTLQRAQFAPQHLPTPAMAPHEAVRLLVRNDVDYVPIDEAYGRVATTLFVVYPPGIASIVPGERLDERAKPMLDYLKMFETSANLFPGFEVEIQGIYREVESDGRVRFHTYVARE